MKTSLITLTKDDVELTLCGAIHIGTKSYYNKLFDYANVSDIVLFENVKSEANSAPSKLMAIYTLFAEALGLIRQPRMIEDTKHVNVDIHEKVFFVLNGGCIEKTVLKDVDFDQLESNIAKVATSKVYRNLVLLLISVVGVTNKILRMFNNHYSALDVRNYIAIAGILEHMNDYKNISIIYGEAHLDGIMKPFIKCGFKISSTKFLDNMEQ